MKPIPKALCWAAIILAMAAVSRWAEVDKDVATTVMIVLPAVAWMAIGGHGSCNSRREA